MIDHLVGRPSPTWKRSQVFLVMLFWIWQLAKGNRTGPRLLWIKKLNRVLARFTPWQVIVSTLTSMYALRHFDTILGLNAPEPLARLYSRNYYRATWIATGLDAGFATAMNIKWKWLRDISSVVFSFYYLVFANEADEKLRKYRAVATVEMLRTTWEKTSNPYLRAITYFDRPRVSIFKKVLIPRPASSKHTKPILAWIFFAGSAEEFRATTDVILDYPGGGYIAMSPAHHEERLRHWAIQTGKIVVAIEYGKAPEYPFPWATEEGFDAYCTIVFSKGRALGLSGEKDLNIIMTGDSAGGNLVTTVMFQIIESPTYIRRPIALLLSYPNLDFNFAAWMTPENLKILRSEQTSNHISVPGVVEQKDHFGHKSPLSVVNDVSQRKLKRRRSWKRTVGDIIPFTPASSSPLASRTNSMSRSGSTSSKPASSGSRQAMQNASGSEGEYEPLSEEQRPILERVKTSDSLAHSSKQDSEGGEGAKSVIPAKAPLGTRITMTSRTGYFQDRIISPSMMRAMAILYIGPSYNPDFQTDYYLSPILAPESVLVEFPPVLINSGEKDPFVDDTVIFAGRIRKAKRDRRAEVERAVAVRAARADDPNLRFTATGGAPNGKSVATPAEQAILAQTEDDWVQMRIIEGWGHGYLQMLSLMPEVKLAIEHLASWMDSVFKARHAAEESGAMSRVFTPGGIHSMRHSPPREGRSTKPPSPARTGPQPKHAVSETETETDVLTFTPKKKRSPPPSYTQLDLRGSNLVQPQVKHSIPTPPWSSEEMSSETPEQLAADLSGISLRSTRNPAISNAAFSQRRRHSYPPKPPNIATATPKSLHPASIVASRETRAGTPILTDVKDGIFLSEDELIKRRRLDAVHGLVAGNGTLDAAQS